jgi:hypothetical protein
MTDQLVAIKIEIDPMRVAAPLRTAQHMPIETTSLRDIAHLHGNVERCQTCTLVLISPMERLFIVNAA